MNSINLLTYYEISNPDYKAILIATENTDIRRFKSVVMAFFKAHIKSDIPSKVEFDEERNTYVVLRLNPDHPVGEFALQNIHW